MLRQYHAGGRQGGGNSLGVGVIAVGSIYYLQSREFFHRFSGRRAVRRNPWIVEGFLNGVCAASRRNHRTGRWDDVYVSRRSDRVVVRSLRDGRRQVVSVVSLVLHDDLALSMGTSAYPTAPDLSLYRVSRRRRCVVPCDGTHHGRHDYPRHRLPFQRP
jgi:hypothetical protein